MNFKLPKELKITNSSTGSIISISSIIAVVSSVFTYLRFDKLTAEYRIIILLSICLLIAIIDIVILYLKDREKQYQYSCLEFLIENITNNTNNLKQEAANIRKENNKIMKEIKILKATSKIKANH